MRSPSIATVSPRSESEESISNAQWEPLGCKYGRASKRGQTERDRPHLRGVLRRGRLNARRQMIRCGRQRHRDSGRRAISGYPGLYKLIFKRLPDDVVYTENDKQMYKSILLITNAHRRGHNALMPILGNKGFKV
ncbi:hypothetical protein P5V15_014731 [Pogonomyrmex californicus]